MKAKVLCIVEWLQNEHLITTTEEKTTANSKSQTSRHGKNKNSNIISKEFQRKYAKTQTHLKQIKKAATKQGNERSRE